MTIQNLTQLYEKDLGKLRSEIEQYPDDNSLWEVAEGITNPGGNLCAHLCGNLRHFIGHNLANDGYVRDREREFSVRGLTKEELCAEIDITIKAVTGALNALDDGDMHDAYPDDKPFPNQTTGTILLHLYAHLSYHLGQVNYHRRLLT